MTDDQRNQQDGDFLLRLAGLLLAVYLYSLGWAFWPTLIALYCLKIL